MFLRRVITFPAFPAETNTATQHYPPHTVGKLQAAPAFCSLTGSRDLFPRQLEPCFAASRAIRASHSQQSEETVSEDTVTAHLGGKNGTAEREPSPRGCPECMPFSCEKTVGVKVQVLKKEPQEPSEEGVPPSTCSLPLCQSLPVSASPCQSAVGCAHM